MKFSSTDTYIATDELQMAVNAAVILERPLLIKGEPGTGKTMLAEEIAKSLGMDLISWHIKSQQKHSRDCMNMMRFHVCRDSQLEMNESTISTTISKEVSCGTLLPRMKKLYC